VLAENPATSVVDGEPVEAVIQDPVSPLIAVQLSDGSAITVTADHPFWVDGGALFKGPGWLTAGQLLPGDRLRTARGTDAMVADVRRSVGQAVVYTLTVAKDHTFFVGNARVLVHNCTFTSFFTKAEVRLVAGDATKGIDHIVADHGKEFTQFRGVQNTKDSISAFIKRVVQNETPFARYSGNDAENALVYQPQGKNIYLVVAFQDPTGGGDIITAFVRTTTGIQVRPL